MNVIPKLANLMEHPERVSDVPLEAVPELLERLEGLKARLWLRLTVPQNNGQSQAQQDKGRMLSAKEVAGGWE